MTPADRAQCLAAIGWTRRGLATRLGVAEGTVRRWLNGASIPPPKVDAWLRMLARFHDAHPAPRAATPTDKGKA